MAERITITTSAPLQLEPGDSIRITDTRRWYVRLWHWSLRRPPPLTDFTITSLDSGTTFGIKPSSKS
jgi:hypothetical protein